MAPANPQALIDEAIQHLTRATLEVSATADLFLQVPGAKGELFARRGQIYTDLCRLIGDLRQLQEKLTRP